MESQGRQMTSDAWYTSVANQLDRVENRLEVMNTNYMELANVVGKNANLIDTLTKSVDKLVVAIDGNGKEGIKDRVKSLEVYNVEQTRLLAKRNKIINIFLGAVSIAVIASVWDFLIKAFGVISQHLK